MDADFPILSPSLCNNGAMRRATRRMGQLYDQILAPSGIKGTQLSLLTQIHRLDSPRLRELADDLVMDISALGHTLKPLVRDGLVELVPDPDDKRAKRAALTPVGERVFVHALSLWEEAHGRFEAIVGAEPSQQLRQTLDWIASPGFASAFMTEEKPKRSDP